MSTFILYNIAAYLIIILAFGVRYIIHQKPPLEAILKNIKVSQVMMPFLFYDVISDKPHRHSHILLKILYKYICDWI